MNLLHLKYAVEVAKTQSISKAAENLFMNQSNLSRAIKDLEDNLGITIFNRTTRGISVTPHGDEFLSYADNILRQVNEVEALYKKNRKDKQKFSISVPRASYISAAFVEFSKCVDRTRPMEIYYRETNTIRAINNILLSDYNLGIIRYQQIFDHQFKTLFSKKDLAYELLCEFSYTVIMARSNPLSNKEDLSYDDLSGFIEIAHADPYVPSLPLAKIREEEYIDSIDKRIFIFERASQYELLQNVPNTFIWASPVPQQTLDKYELVQIPCASDKRIYKDVLIYRKGYILSELDKLFITEICKAKRMYLA